MTRTCFGKASERLLLFLPRYPLEGNTVKLLFTLMPSVLLQAYDHQRAFAQQPHPLLIEFTCPFPKVRLLLAGRRRWSEGFHAPTQKPTPAELSRVRASLWDDSRTGSSPSCAGQSLSPYHWGRTIKECRACIGVRECISCPNQPSVAIA